MAIEFLLDAFATHQADDAIVWRDRVYSFGWLSETVRDWMRRLQAGAVEPGSVVSLDADFSPNAVSLMLALVAHRCIVVPLTTSVETKKPEQREPLLKFLNDAGIDAKTHYSIAIHRQAGYPWDKGARIVGPLSNAEHNAACCISLPMFPELTTEEVDYVIAKVKEWDKAQG